MVAELSAHLLNDINNTASTFAYLTVLQKAAAAAMEQGTMKTCKYG